MSLLKQAAMMTVFGNLWNLESLSVKTISETWFRNRVFWSSPIASCFRLSLPVPSSKICCVPSRCHQETLAFSGITWPLGDAGGALVAPPCASRTCGVLWSKKHVHLAYSTYAAYAYIVRKYIYVCTRSIYVHYIYIYTYMHAIPYWRLSTHL